MRNWLRSAWPGGKAGAVAVVAAGVLLLLGLGLAVVNEDAHRRQQGREVSTQAEIVAASVAPALAFFNDENAQEYLNGLRANPSIQAAAVYDANGARVAEFHRSEAAPAPSSAGAPAVVFQGDAIIAVTSVRQGGEGLGAVYLRSMREPALQRFSRYAGVGILILLAAIVVTLFGLAQGAMEQANAQLADRAAKLEREIEARTRAEEELLQSRKLEAIGQLTGGVAHDFNNLLTVVLSGIRLMERSEDPARRASTMEAMRQAVERGAGLTKQLLAFARRQALTFEVIDLPRQLGGMRALLERSLRADILVDLQIPDDLWPVKTDPTQFELAILNLAVNARDAMVKGGVLTVSAENVTTAGGEYVEIHVRDTGCGMAAEIVQRVFEPYFTTKSAGQGTGLGLSQVYGIATQSGGEVRIDSAPNKGTTVTLRLPRSAEAPPARAAPEAAADTAAIGGLNVLVVEDDEAVAAVVIEMLETLACRPVRVASGTAALEALGAGRTTDLVFSDIVMPGEMNGVELAERVRQLYPRLPVVLTTGYSGSADLSAGYPVLRKPYQIEDLGRILAAAISRSRRSETAAGG